MSVVLLDASVVIALVIPEEVSEQAVALVHDAAFSHRRLVCPPHLRYEVLTAIDNRTRLTDKAQRLSAKEANDAINVFLMFGISMVNSTALHRRAWELVQKRRVPTVSIGLYLALADLLQSPVWTADHRLLQVRDAGHPLVQWIGDYTRAA